MEESENTNQETDTLIENAIVLAQSAVQNVINLHEMLMHDGEVCEDERRNLAAYLYTILGLEAKDIKLFKQNVIQHQLQQLAEDDEADEQDQPIIDEEDEVLNAKEITIH